MRVSATTGLSGLTRKRAAWRPVAWALLLAFTLQSFITQTHIHLPNFGPAHGVQLVKRAPAQAPIDREPANCPFCQAVASSGIFFTPAAPVLLLPTEWAAVAAPAAIENAIVRVFPYHWRSRAPPQH